MTKTAIFLLFLTISLSSAQDGIFLQAPSATEKAIKSAAAARLLGLNRANNNDFQANNAQGQGFNNQFDGLGLGQNRFQDLGNAQGLNNLQGAQNTQGLTAAQAANLAALAGTKAEKSSSSSKGKLVGKFMFVNKESGKVLKAVKVGKFATLIQADSTGDKSEAFKVYQVSFDSFKVIAADGKALVLDNLGAENVYSFEKSADDLAQLWSFSKQDSSWGLIQSKVTAQALQGGSSVAIDGTSAFGVRAVSKDSFAGEGQLWALVRVNC